jgi:hypothetical protein
MEFAGNWRYGTVARRLPHGATARPPFTRPGNGYGRPLGPGPRAGQRRPEPTRTDTVVARLLAARTS